MLPHRPEDTAAACWLAHWRRRLPNVRMFLTCAGSRVRFGAHRCPSIRRERVCRLLKGLRRGPLVLVPVFV